MEWEGRQDWLELRKKCKARKWRCLVKMVFGSSFMEEATECEFKLLREKIKPKKQKLIWTLNYWGKKSQRNQVRSILFWFALLSWSPNFFNTSSPQNILFNYLKAPGTAQMDWLGYQCLWLQTDGIGPNYSHNSLMWPPRISSAHQVCSSCFFFILVGESWSILESNQKQGLSLHLHLSY